MAREIVSWCDVCFNAEPPVHETGTEVTVMVGRDKLRRVDLCEPHRKELVDPLMSLLREHGITVDAPSPGGFNAAPRPYTRRKGRKLDNPNGPTCPVEGCTAEGGFAHFESLRVHAKRSHALGRVEFARVYGDNLREQARKLSDEEPKWLPVTDADDDEVLQYDDEPELTFEEKKQKAAEVMANEQVPEEFVCGVDGCDKAYPPSVYQKPTQALGMHRAQKHGIVGTSKRSKNNRDARRRAGADA